MAEAPFYSENEIGIIDDYQLPNNIGEILSSNATVNVEPYEIDNLDRVSVSPAT